MAESFIVGVFVGIIIGTFYGVRKGIEITKRDAIELTKCVEINDEKTYTQAMKDSGKPIEAGMWFKFGEDEEFKCILPPDIKGILVADEKGAYRNYHVTRIAPFPT